MADIVALPEHLQLVRAVLRRVLPQCEVRAFGSRVSGTVKPYSDLDLCVRCGSGLSLAIKAELAEAFSESDLPWRVDIVDWSSLSEAWRQSILARSVVLQDAGECHG